MGPNDNRQIVVNLRFKGFGIGGSTGQITFRVSSGQPAGNPAVVTYMISPCNGG